MEKFKLTVSIVNWNSEKILETCIDTLYKYIPKNITYEIIFVDNASIDNSVNIIGKKYPGIKIIKNEENLGFGTAHNKVIKTAQGEHILFLNTDVLLSEGSIEKLINFMDGHNNIALCSPLLLGEGGRQQETGISFPSLITEIFGRINIKRKELPYKVDAVRGACMLGKASIIKNLGGFNEKYFLFLEETDLCYRLNKHSYEVWVLPEVKVIHKGGGSAETIKVDARIEYWRSRYKFFKDNYSSLSYFSLNLCLGIKLFIDIIFNTFAALCTLGLNQKFRNKLKSYSKIFAWHILGRSYSWGIGPQNIIRMDGWITKSNFRDWLAINQNYILNEKEKIDLIKENSSRKLFIYDKEFYVKAYKTRNFFKKPWLKEWMLINKIRQFGIPTVIPVAVREGYLITKKMEGVKSLHDFFLENKQTIKFEDKNNFIKSFAGFIKTLHLRGVFHEDLHAGNILVQKEKDQYEFYIIDLHRAKIKEYISKKDIVSNIVELHKFFSLYLSSVDRLRFFKYYANGTVFDKEYKKYAQSISKKTETACFILWNKRDRLYIKKSKYAIKRKHNNIKYVLNPLYKNINIESLLDCVTNRKGQVIKDSRSSFVSRVDLGDSEKIIIKIYRQKKIINYIKDIFRKSRGFKAWCGSWALITRNIDTPKPIMAGEIRIFGVVKESFFISEDILESKNLTMFVKDKSESEIKNISKNIFSFLRIVHGRGVFPLDMKGSNILIRDNNCNLKTYLIDLDHIKLCPNVKKHERLYNVLQIRKSTGIVCTESIHIKRILIVKPSSFGDIVQSLPVAHMLREQFKGATVWWLTNNNYLDFFKLVSAVDKTISFERQKWGNVKNIFKTIPEVFFFLLNIRRKKFDLVLDLQGLFRSGVISWISGAPLRIGFGDIRDFAYIFYNIKIYPEKDILHAQERYFYLAVQVTKFKNPNVLFNIPELEKKWAENIWGNRLRIAINPGGRWDTKRWPAEKYSYIINEFIKKPNVKIVILGDERDSNISKNIKSDNSSDIVDLAGKTNFIELTAILNSADILITNDSGTMHLADSLCVPIVALFGPTDPRKTGPKGKDAVVIRSKIQCSPCFNRVCKENECMKSIDEKTVLHSAEDLLKKRLSVI